MTAYVTPTDDPVIPADGEACPCSGEIHADFDEDDFLEECPYCGETVDPDEHWDDTCPNQESYWLKGYGFTEDLDEMIDGLGGLVEDLKAKQAAGWRIEQGDNRVLLVLPRETTTNVVTA